MNVAKGVITASTTNGNTSVVTPTGFSAGEPLRAIIVWAAYNTADGTVADARFSLGFGTFDGAAIQQGGTLIYSKGTANADSDVAFGMNTTWILRGLSAAVPTVDYEIGLTAFSDTSFTLTYTDAPASAIKIHYMALGGSDVSGARCGSTIMATGVGTTDVTVDASWGQPKLLFSLADRNNALHDADVPPSGASVSLGVATSNTVRQAATMQVRDAQTASNVGLHQKQRWLTQLTNNVAHSQWDLSALASWPVDGFQINKVVSGSGSLALIWLALKGTFQTAIGVDLSLTAGSTDDIAAGFAPAGALLFGGNLPATAGTVNTSHADLGQFFVGGTDGTNEGCASWIDDDAAATMNTFSQHSETKIIEYYTPTTPTKVSDADASFSGTNLRLTWTDLDTAAREYVYLILGPATATAVPYTNRTYPQILPQ